MNRFWDLVLRVLIEAARARRIVEVGVASGLLTEKVLGYCAESGAVLHAIDPFPDIDVREWENRYGETLVFHHARSLEVLGDLHHLDVALIDGDHNWFTVYNELRVFEATALADGTVPPLLALHDVDWPYGRRDMYYDPDSVPAEYRQRYVKLGLAPGRPDPVDGGFNWDLYNAVQEGSPHNGVRTAIEDFLDSSQVQWRTFYIPGFHGLGIVVTEDRLRANDALRAAIESLQTKPFLTFLRDLEEQRIGSAVEAHRVQYGLIERQRAQIEELEERAAEEAGKTQQLERLLLDTERLLACTPDLELRAAELERELGDARRTADDLREQALILDDRVTRGQRTLADVMGSPSWRLTKPLRSAKHLLR